MGDPELKQEFQQVFKQLKDHEERLRELLQRADPGIVDGAMQHVSGDIKIGAGFVDSAMKWTSDTTGGIKTTLMAAPGNSSIIVDFAFVRAKTCGSL